LLALLGGCGRREMVPVGSALFDAKPLYRADFADLRDWTAETSCPPRVERGELIWPCDTPDGQGTLWLNRRFEGPLLVTYTVTPVSGMDNVNLIAYAEHPGGLLETTATRTGEYAEYHRFPNYIVTFLTNDEPRWRVRFRRNPGFALLSETYAQIDTASGVPRRVAHHFDGAGGMALFVDGVLVHEANDTTWEPHQSGYIGLRTWRSELRYRDVRVYALRPSVVRSEFHPVRK